MTKKSPRTEHGDVGSHQRSRRRWEKFQRSTIRSRLFDKTDSMEVFKEKDTADKKTKKQTNKETSGFLPKLLD